ncbi:hypothetical protein HMPREF3293_00924 [Christensenella minuta]|uniref:Uncharacterized protein n=1 Tax=Christensenella minuta TaxID=626937 RepID=A0A136Q686_9FIRM|nr:hypothetical protein HMPREF3293_00924 [Christensenella minuta]
MSASSYPFLLSYEKTGRDGLFQRPAFILAGQIAQRRLPACSGHGRKALRCGHIELSARIQAARQNNFRAANGDMPFSPHIAVLSRNFPPNTLFDSVIAMDRRYFL